MFDVRLFAKLGTILSGCVAIPLAITSLTGERITEKNQQTNSIKVTEDGDKIGPIFVCENNTSNYKIYLTFDSKKLSRVNGVEDSHIVLQVYEQEKGNEHKEQVVWGPTVSENKWIKWNIDILGDVTIQLLPGVLGKDEYGQTASCSHNQVILKKDNHYGRFLEVEKGIKKKGAEFKVDLQSCRDKEECDIVFSENDFFQWKTVFQPKVTIPLVEIG